MTVSNRDSDMRPATDPDPRRNPVTRYLALVALAVLAGCATTTGTSATTAPGGGTTMAVPMPSSWPGTPPPPVPGPLPAGDPNWPMPAPGTCHLGDRAGQPVPDPACTPGAINPDVTPATLDSTICKAGWTATIRPPVSVTGPFKVKMAKAYSVTVTAGSDELDHYVPLEAGGAPLDSRNLWVEPGPIPNGKDAVEGKLKTAICARKVDLAAAQQAIATDWTTALQRLGLG